MGFKESFAYTPSGSLFGMYYSKHAHFSNGVFYYDSVFEEYLDNGDINAKELWDKALAMKRATGMQMIIFRRD